MGDPLQALALGILSAVVALGCGLNLRSSPAENVSVLRSLVVALFGGISLFLLTRFGLQISLINLFGSHRPADQHHYGLELWRA